MTTQSIAPSRHGTLSQTTLSRLAVCGLAAGGVAVTAVLFAVTPLQGTADFLVVATLLSLLSVTTVTGIVEGRRRAVDRLATNAALVALVLTLLPLGFILGYTVYRGAKRFTLSRQFRVERSAL